MDFDTFTENLDEIKKSCIMNVQDIVSNTPDKFTGEKGKWIKTINERTGITIKNLNVQVHNIIVKEKTEHYLYTIKRIQSIQSPRKNRLGHITNEDIKKVKEYPICDVYEGKLKKRAGRYVGRCEFHSEKTGSFVIYIKQNSWYCFGCHSGGSVIDYIMKKYNLDFINAVKKII